MLGIVTGDCASMTEGVCVVNPMLLLCPAAVFNATWGQFQVVSYFRNQSASAWPPESFYGSFLDAGRDSLTDCAVAFL